LSGDIWSGQSSMPDSCCIEEKIGCAKRINANETFGLIYTDVCLKNMIEFLFRKKFFILRVVLI
jgi:hypothetical protein